ncbi:2-amino-4-hydroxy-6-hydroxymethyldihydropteridine diphosphokinase [Aliarcobacter thereius]|uniref:2-amino-4-hydroxy-6-hydroxymethyldihydropteridine pyrophosphokinase n=2 Tax=Aliarcobacter thereius TaxID=544718 RepID=A0A5R9GZK6_9BACT|nr:2-amino-4-hydroxy-6-hydroxymethyldihydropteridine diphosphokinase [Aliarcobacter thereius]OCL92251.1 2-amino-4-hydroxy-6-hydroxymethyldihydropteridine pyrophosphokinase [Aliarcobacter thereius]OCL94653.1 2-amino-4-hydroxy-6-hydroxymethyldihydropteridine pyrophosphokinase [Aliarcobacter thereius LMG 24486]QBF15471.1 6-hydroxymethyl-7,8-dihydropterin pyrophosphokinase [Aliarcobacter thereius LMG 24486]TLS72311.1 2-amino-4-hydroxy-6-hydroxymethyldihydropteridine diphosphokinase [Aliarcobacter t
MKKTLSPELTLFYNSNFPKKFNNSSLMKHLVTIGIGGNIGNTKLIFDKLILCLKKDTRFTLLMTSPILKNPPFGFLQQSDFLNGIILLKTNLCPNDFLKAMQRYENKFGRKRSFQDAPRTLDIDIIFFDDKKINTKNLIIPHKNWANRESVIIPLKYMKK